MTKTAVNPKTNEKIPFEETWQGFEAEVHAKKTYELIKCSTCIYGTDECKKHKSPHFNPDSYCIDFKPDWKKIYPLME